MLNWQRDKNRIFVRLATLIMAQVFFVTNLGYSESIHINSKGLRVPVGFGKVGSDTALSDRIHSAQAQARDTISAESILSSLKEIQEQIAEYTRAGAITEEEQRIQDAYFNTVQELLLANSDILNAMLKIEKQYLNYIVQDWIKQINIQSKYAKDHYITQGYYIRYAELVLFEIKVTIAIAKGEYLKSIEKINYEDKDYFVKIYVLNDLPWQVVEYVDEAANGFMSRVYFYPDGYTDKVIFERARKAALITGIAISDFKHDAQNSSIFSQPYYRHFITSDHLASLPGRTELWNERFSDGATVMAVKSLGICVSIGRIFGEYARSTEQWVRHLRHEIGHKAEEHYLIESGIDIPKWFTEGTKNAQFWSKSYDVLFILQLIRGESVVRLNNDINKLFSGAEYPHAALFCDYIDDATNGKLAKGWVEIERRVGQDGLKFEQAFEEVIGQPLQELMDQFYSQLIPLAIQSVDRVVELEYEREAIQKATGIDVSAMSIEELKNILRKSLSARLKFDSIAKHGLLSPQSAVEQGVALSASSMPGHFKEAVTGLFLNMPIEKVETYYKMQGYDSSMKPIYKPALVIHFTSETSHLRDGYGVEIEGWEIKEGEAEGELRDRVRKALTEYFVTGRGQGSIMTFIATVVERDGEKLRDTAKLPKEVLERRALSSVLFLVKAEHTEEVYFRGADQRVKDISPEKLAYVLVPRQLEQIARQAFNNLPIKIIPIDINPKEKSVRLVGKTVDLQVPDYEKALNEIFAQDDGIFFGHIVRLDTIEELTVEMNTPGPQKIGRDNDVLRSI